MLNVLRRNREKLKWLLLLVIAGLTVSLGLFFVDTPGGMAGPGAQEVATVAGEPIRAAAYQRAYRQIYDTYQQLYNLNEQPPEIVQQLGLPQQALNQLISAYAICYQAEQMGLTVTEQELRNEIASFPGLQINGQFVGAQQYTRILQGSGLTPREFEDGVRRSMLTEKLRSVITDGVQATDAEVRQDFLERHQQVNLRYALFDTQAAPDEPIGQDELKIYYENNQGKYEQPELRSLTYIEVPIDAAQATVSEDDITRELNALPVEEQVHVRHILVRSRDGDDNEDEARAKAEDLLGQIQNGADFAELARRHTDDTVTRAEGGDMGFINRGQTVPEFENAAFGLEPGEVADQVVKTPFGFHIIQTLAKTTASREGMRPRAELQARQNAARGQAEALARQMAERVRSGATLETVASENGLSVATTSPIASSGTIDELPVTSTFKQEMFSQPQGTVLEVGSTPTSFVVARVAEIVPGRIPPFEEVADVVSADYLSERSSDLARNRANRFFEKSLETSLEETARTEGVALQETGFWEKSTGEIDPNLLFSPEIKERAFRMEVGEVSSPVMVRENYVIFEVAEKSEVDEAAFEAEKAELKRQLTETRRQEFFNQYLERVLNSLREQDLISVNADLVSQIAGLS